jgi:hypothetical protein
MFPLPATATYQPGLGDPLHHISFHGWWATFFISGYMHPNISSTVGTDLSRLWFIIRLSIFA